MKFNPILELAAGIFAAAIVGLRRYGTWSRAGSLDPMDQVDWRQYIWIVEIVVASFAGYAAALSGEQLFNCGLIAISQPLRKIAGEIGISWTYTGTGSLFGLLLSATTIVFLYFRYQPLCFRRTLNSDNCEIDGSGCIRTMTEDIPPKHLRWESETSRSPVVRAKFDRESKRLASRHRARVDATLVNDGKSYRVAVASRNKTANKALGDHVYVVIIIWVPV